MPERDGISRRGFLGGAAAAAAGTALLGEKDARAFSVLRTPEALPAEREVPSFCEVCFWNCGLIARVRKNRLLALRGHPRYPTAQGRLCARGNAGPATVTDGDRLKHPMVRTGARGAGEFRRVTWKEAYRRIADGFARIKAQHGARALALFYHGAGGPLLRHMMVAYGSPNFAAPSYAQCKGPRNVGYALTFGEKLGSPEPLDLDQTRCVVLFGSHLGENAHNSQVQELVRARARGAKLIVLDPRLSTVASKADLWLRLRPGSDLAVILSWLHLLIAEDAYDHDFVARRCVGFDELRAHVAPCTPAWAAGEAGVPEEQIVAAYQLMRAARPAVLVHPGRHVTWYGEADTQRARGQAILTALLGAWWAPGGIYRAEKPEVADFPSPDYPELPKDVDHEAGRFPFAQECTTNGIRDATITGVPYPIKGWFVHGTNLMQALPGRAETEAAIAALDLLVVCDILPTEITRYADVLLPEDTYLERYDDLLLGGAKFPFIGLRQPAVVSPHDTRPAWRIAKELGTELGLADYFAFESFEDYLGARLAPTGVSLEQLKVDGIILPPRKTSPYLAPDEEVHFHTPSGKVELYSQQLADKGFAPLPVHRAPAPPPPGRFRLLYGRSPAHSFARTENNPILHDLDPTNRLWMSPAAAAAAGLADGAWVEAVSEAGHASGRLRLHVTARMPDDAVYMIHGFGQRSRALSRASGVGGDDNRVIDSYLVDPISGATGMRGAMVAVRRVG
jgi:thiosulfate reductase / polysulfide reductase chain A